jgi:hypothetical protein
MKILLHITLSGLLLIIITTFSWVPCCSQAEPAVQKVGYKASVRESGDQIECASPGVTSDVIDMSRGRQQIGVTAISQKLLP